MLLNAPNCRPKFGIVKLSSDSVHRLLQRSLSWLLTMRMRLTLLRNHLLQKFHVLQRQQLPRLGSSSHVAKMTGIQWLFGKITRNVFHTAK